MSYYGYCITFFVVVTYPGSRSNADAWHKKRCTQARHVRLCATIRREISLLYDVKFSAGDLVAFDSKQHICRALD
eukprot:2062323-Pleurochrysis_carterae.AAC.1